MALLLLCLMLPLVNAAENNKIIEYTKKYNWSNFIDIFQNFKIDILSKNEHYNKQIENQNKFVGLEIFKKQYPDFAQKLKENTLLTYQQEKDNNFFIVFMIIRGKI